MFRKLPDIVEFYSSIYGPYLFEAVGAIVDDAPEVGYSLETQTKPVFYRPGRGDARARDLPHVVRRLGHAHRMARHLAARGFRDMVGVDLERAQRTEVCASLVQDVLQHPSAGHGVLDAAAGRPGGPAFMFNGTIYNRGAMTLQALLEDQRRGLLRALGRVGQPEPLRQCDDARVHRVGGEGERRQELDEFFDVWLYRPEKPTSW